MGGVGLLAGQVIWGELEPVIGPEQGGRRPCVVLSSTDFSNVVAGLTIVVPCTTRHRGWDSHVPITGETGLLVPTYAITEQPRTISVNRVHGLAGHVDEYCLTEITRWVRAWLHPAA